MKPRFPYALAAMVFWCLPVVLADPALAHRRAPGAPAALPAAAAPAGEATSPPTPAPEKLTAPELWSHIQRLEKAGDVSACLKSLGRFINVFPQHPQRPEAFLKMAMLAQADGQIAKALKVYTLAAALYPNTQTAEQARLGGAVLEFYEELGGTEPLATFERFLNQLAGWPAKPAPQVLREPLAAGWQAVERQMATHSSCPAAWLERLLVIWELHPQGTRPPEAALLLGRLLREKGLAQEAWPLLNLAWERGSGHLRGRAVIELLELAWAAQGLPGFLKALDRFAGEGKDVALALNSWLLRLSPEKAAHPPGSGEKYDFAAAAGPEQAPARLNLWAQLLGQPLPEPLREFGLKELARACWARGDLPQAARLYQAMATDAANPENFSFYQDRLGLAHLKSRDQDAAQEVFRGLERADDPFWQLLAQTRLMDLELARLQAEPAP